LSLHWAVASPTLVRFALEARPGSGAEKGWVAVGWSEKGKMFPSDAIIGNTAGGAISAYTITGRTLATISATSAFAIGAPSIVTLTPSANGAPAGGGIGVAEAPVANGSTILRFARTTIDGLAPVTLTGGNRIIWAFSADETQTLAGHGPLNRGSALVYFNCSPADTHGSAPLPPALDAPASSPAVAAPPSVAAQPSEPAVAEPSKPSKPAVAAPSAPAPAAPKSGKPAKASAAAVAAAEAAMLGCSPSPLANYTCSLKLSGDNFILHWKSLSKTSVAIAAEAATTGFLSLGWSRGGRMAPSDAAIGNLPFGAIANGAAVGAFYIGGYEESEVVPSGDFKLDNTAVESKNGRTIMKFERSTTDGTAPINAEGSTTVIWSFSDQPSLSFHGSNCGSASVNFVNTTAAPVSSSSNSSKQAVLLAHGIMLALAYALLMPLGVLLARLFLYDRPTLPSEEEKETHTNRGLWFLCHKYIQIFAVLLVVTAAIMVFIVSGSQGLEWTHGKLGVVALALTFVQPFLGFFRPDKGTSQRPAWLTFHWAMGIAAIAMGCANVFLGIDVYGQLYGGNQDS
ncbi:unnamed protein product, partial [Closterium sp. NIES-53]